MDNPYKDAARARKAYHIASVLATHGIDATGASLMTDQEWDLTARELRITISSAETRQAVIDALQSAATM